MNDYDDDEVNDEEVLEQRRRTADMLKRVILSEIEKATADLRAKVAELESRIEELESK